MDPIPRDPETPTYETLRVGAVTPLNGYSATGIVQIIDSAGSLRFETLSDFSISSTVGTLDCYLTDSVGSLNIAASFTNTKFASLTTFSGHQRFPVSSYSSYTYLAFHSPQAGNNVGRAKWLLPLPPSDI